MRAERDAADRARERVGQRLHAVAEGEAAARGAPLRALLPAFPRRLDLAANDAAVLLLERVDARKRGGERDPLRISRVDAGDERVDRILENLRAKPAAGEVGDRFLDLGGRRCDERLAPQAELGAGRERGTHEERAGRRRQRDQPAVADDVARGGDRARLDALVADVKRIEELVDERRGIERAVRAGLVERAVAMDRADHAARAASGLEHLDRQAAPVQFERRREPRQPGADDRDIDIGAAGVLIGRLSLPAALRAACGR